MGDPYSTLAKIVPFTAFRGALPAREPSPKGGNPAIDGLLPLKVIQRIDAGHAQVALETGRGRVETEVRGGRWVNFVLSIMKRSISGVYYSIRQAKYERRCLNESAYRFYGKF